MVMRIDRDPRTADALGVRPDPHEPPELRWSHARLMETDVGGLDSDRPFREQSGIGGTHPTEAPRLAQESDGGSIVRDVVLRW
jgi:hypothetical protein